MSFPSPLYVIPEQSGIHLLTKVGVKYLQLVIMTGKLKRYILPNFCTLNHYFNIVFNYQIFPLP